MRLNKKELLARIDAVLAADEKEARTAHDKQTKANAAALEKWRKDGAPKLAEKLSALAAKARRGTPVSYDDVVHVVEGSSTWSRRKSGVTFEDSLPEKFDYTPNTRLVALRSFLSTVADDEVSTTGLRDAGFRDHLALLARKS